MSAALTSNVMRLKAAVLAILPDLLSLWLPAGERRGDTYVALNPKRFDRKLGSFVIDLRTGKWRDHAIGIGGGDAVSLYAYLFAGDDYRVAFRTLANDPQVKAALACGAMAPPTKIAVPLKQQAAKLAQVRRIYDDAGGLSGTPAATYLHSRGLFPTDAWEGLRASVMSYRGVGAYPVLIAPIDALDGSLVGLHRTYLTPNGAKLNVPNPRLTFGTVKGGAIRLGEATEQLIICEGLEDGLTIYHQLGIPVWAACGAGFMRAMAIPDTIRALVIGADNDTAGKRAALEAADAHHMNDRIIRIMRPNPGFKDFNDQLRGTKS